MCDFCNDSSDICRFPTGQLCCGKCGSTAAFALADKVMELEEQIAELKKDNYKKAYEEANAMLARAHATHVNEMFELRNEMERIRLGIKTA